MKKRKLFISILTVFFICFMGMAFSACGEEHAHSYTRQTTTEATCTTKGIITYTCSCNDTYTEEIPVLGHDEKTHEAQAPTCTEIGWNEYVTCERDGCEYSTYEEIPALTHDKVQHNAQTATCTEVGWNAYETCTRCNYTTYVKIPATGNHTWDDGEETKAPTCTKEGVTTYTCTVCKTTTKTEPIDKLPHEQSAEWESNATHHWHECACGDKADEAKHTPSAPATATTPQTCTVCGYILQAETGILFNTLTVNGSHAYGKVSNATTEFSFINEVTVKGNATYVVDNDKDCCSPIYSKTVDLAIGDNTFYVLEMIGNDVKLFTVTIRRHPMYDVTFNANGGTSVEKQIIEEDYLATEPETTRTGYTFTGWDYDFAMPITDNTEITATWSANKDTKYTVNYYLQNLDDNNYTLHETVELEGTTDTTVMADIKVYTHFTFNDGYVENKLSGNIDGDGSRVLSVYYTRDSYDVVVNNNNAKAGVSTQINDTYKYEKEITLTVKTNAGYTWLGWYNGETLACATEEFTFKVEKDVTYTATWSANKDTKYTVNYYLQNLDDNNYTLHETVELEGTTDTTVTADIKEYNQFTYNKSESTISGNIAGGSSLVLNVYYTRDSYTITTDVNNTKAGMVTNGNTYRFDKQITLTATTNAGYSFLGWYEGETLACATANFTLNVQKNVMYIAKWQANTDTRYTINYYLQNIDNNNYTLYEIEESTGTTDTIVTATVKEYQHFTYKASVSTLSGTIKGDGSLVLNVYYTRASYTIATGNNNAKAGTVTRGGTYRYEKRITLTATTNAGYTFLGWYEGDVCVCETEALTFDVDKTATYMVKWQANEDTVYTVKYYLQNIDNDNYTVYETVELEGTTDTIVTAEIKSYSYFTYQANASTISGNLNGDGSQVLSVYYTRDSYTISTARNNTKAGVVTEGGSYRYNKEITITATTNAGYTFLGWYKDEMYICGMENYMFNVESSATYTAKWSANDDTAYVVNYYLQTLNGNYILNQAQSLTGVTDTTATAEIKTYQHFTYNASESTISGNINGDDSLVLKVYYTRDKYTIDAELNTSLGGTISGTGLHFYDTELTLTATTNAGYTFLGWYEGEEILTENTEYMLTVESNKIYTAKWSANINTLKFDGNGATDGSMQELQIYTDETQNLPQNEFSKGQYYAFAGWATSPNGSVLYADKAEFTMSSASEYTLYAVWEEIFVVENDIVKGLTTFGNTLGEIIIPDSVTAIGDKAFDNCTYLTKISIPDSVTTIGSYAFRNCDNLTSVVIGDGVTSIGDYAFAFCDRLGPVVIGDSVTSIGDGAFKECKRLTSIKIPDGVTSIGDYAFYYCSILTSVVIPNSVTAIGDYAFAFCDRLAYNKNNGLAYLGNEENPYLYLYKQVSAISNDPSSIINKKCQIIGSAVFRGNSLTSIVIPSGITSIGAEAFSESSLTSVTFPNNLSHIGNKAFYRCTGLKILKIPNSVTSIGSNAFTGCGGTSLSVTCPASVVSCIPKSNLISITITSGEIPSYAFTECYELLKVEIGDGVTSVGSYAFYRCTALETIIIGTGVTSIGKYAFYNLHDTSDRFSIKFKDQNNWYWTTSVENWKNKVNGTSSTPRPHWYGDYYWYKL